MDSVIGKFVSDKKVFIFGTGSACKNMLKDFPYKVESFIDNDPKKWGQKFINSVINSPDKLLEEKKDEIVILIANMFYSEISMQLEKMGFVKNQHFFNGLKTIENARGQKQIITLEYPVDPKPRYGYGKPLHGRLQEILKRNNEKYAETLKWFTSLKNKLKEIPLSVSKNESSSPCWMNKWMPGLDALSLYGFTAMRKPRYYIEVGSGFSTKFVRRAIQDYSLSTRIISIDPEPRAEIDTICDEIIRLPLENYGLEIFKEMNAGDILFIDNSHRSFMNSDVTVTFLDIIPYLKKDILVGFHDIFLPKDYPPTWGNRFYSEQYLLASWILAEGQKFQIELPNTYIMNTPEIISISDQLFEEIDLKENRHGAAFWIEMN